MVSVLYISIPDSKCWRDRVGEGGREVPDEEGSEPFEFVREGPFDPDAEADLDGNVLVWEIVVFNGEWVLVADGGCELNTELGLGEICLDRIGEGSIGTASIGCSTTHC
jgi:hypothetical protein